MKQGRADRSGMAGGKVEPRAHAVSPAGAAQIGIKQVSDSLKDPLNMGRGYNAPAPAGCNVHHSGSQGKHK